MPTLPVVEAPVHGVEGDTEGLSGVLGVELV